MEEDENTLDAPASTRVPLSSYCSTCFRIPKINNTLILEPPRLEDLALQVITSFIARCRTVVSDVNHCQSFRDAIPKSAHTDLVKYITFAILRRHAHEELDWKSTKNGLENFVKCLADVESKHEKTDQKSASSDHILSALEGDSSDNKDEASVSTSPSNIYAVSAIIFKYMREHACSVYTEHYQLIENLQEFPESLQILQNTKQAIQQFLNTGPHKCLDEKECECLADLVQHVPLPLANEFTELLGWPLKCETSKDKRILESLVHPAVTRIQIPTISNEITHHVFLKIVPTLKYLRQVTLSITVTLCNTRRYLNKAEEEILTNLSISCNLLKELRLHLVPSEADEEVDLIELSQQLTQLPVSLSLLKCHGSSNTCRVEDLNAMACSERFSSLYCLSLSGMNCNIPLRRGFQRLAVMEIEKFFFKSSLFLKDIGSQLQVISLCFVYMLKLQELAKSCPLLQVLKVKNCSVLYDPQEPEPEFKHLREFHFISNYFHSTFDGICIAFVLKHSFHLQKLEIFIKDTNLSACLEHLCKNKSISELREVELYKYDSMEAQGLLSREMIDQILKHCPYLYMMGGIESLETKNALSKMYPKMKFLCVSQKLQNYCSAEHLKFLEDRVVFLDVSDMNSY